MIDYLTIKNMAKDYKVPMRINLVTRRNKCETVLDLVGFDADEYRYRISASYPYGVTGKEPNIVAVDFSEGPTLHVGGKLDKLTIVRFELPVIVCKK